MRQARKRAARRALKRQSGIFAKPTRRHHSAEERFCNKRSAGHRMGS